MDFRDYTYVQAIAHHKNISKAAEALYISQPSLSKFLQKLEDTIGTPLFDRINKQMHPTYAGEQFLKTGQEIFLLQNRLDYTIEQITQQKAGRLSLTTTSTRGYYVLTEILPEFKKLYPEYHIEILDRNVDEVEQNIRDGISNLAVYIVTTKDPEFKYYPICTEEVVLCLSGSSPYIKKAIQKDGFQYPWLDLSLLKHEPFFLNESGHWMIGRVGRQLLTEAHMNPEITYFRNLETSLSLASRGLGFTFTFDISVSCFKNYVDPPVYLSVGNVPNKAEFVIATRKNHKLSQAEEDFVALVQKRFGK